MSCDESSVEDFLNQNPENPNQIQILVLILGETEKQNFSIFSFKTRQKLENLR